MKYPDYLNLSSRQGFHNTWLVWDRQELPNLINNSKSISCMDFPTLATFFSGLSFLFYGTACLASPRMKDEFIRFGYDRQRVLTGYLQLLGGLGLLTGYFLAPLLAFFAAAGLSLMMLFGFGVRLQIRDSLLAASPAILYAVLNLYLSVHYYGLFS